MSPELAALVARFVDPDPDAPRIRVRAECERIGVSTTCFYKYVARFRLDGVAGFAPRSRAPVSSPARVDAHVEELVVRARKQLAEDGWDAGAGSIRFWLERLITQDPDQWPAGAAFPSPGHGQPDPETPWTGAQRDPTQTAGGYPAVPGRPGQQLLADGRLRVPPGRPRRSRCGGRGGGVAHHRRLHPLRDRVDGDEERERRRGLGRVEHQRPTGTGSRRGSSPTTAPRSRDAAAARPATWRRTSPPSESATSPARSAIPRPAASVNAPTSPPSSGSTPTAPTRPSRSSKPASMPTEPHAISGHASTSTASARPSSTYSAHSTVPPTGSTNH